MDVRRAMLLVMAHMALADGKVTADEVELLNSMLAPGESFEELQREASEGTLVQLLEPITSYADRFFVALRAASMAHIDLDFDLREEALYERLLKLLEIEEDDRALIARSVAALEEPQAVDPEPRILELFEQSSFF